MALGKEKLLINNFKLTSRGGKMNPQDVKVDEVVWAKLQGWPWWPAKVIDSNLGRPGGSRRNTAHYSPLFWMEEQ